MAKSGPALLQGVIKGNLDAARNAREQNQRTLTPEANNARWKDSPEARLFKAYDDLEKALQGSTLISPEELEQSKKVVSRHQRSKRRGVEQKIISLNQQEIRAEKKEILRKLTPPKRDRAGTIFESKPETGVQTPPPETGNEPVSPSLSISLNLEEVSENLSDDVETNSDVAQATTAPSDESVLENQSLLPPTAPKPIRVTYTETTRTDSPSPVTIQPLPQGPSALRQQMEMIRMFNQAQSAQGPGSMLNQIWRLATSTPESIISGVSGGSIGPGALMSGGPMAAGGAPAAGMPGGAAAQGAKGLASQLPKLAAALKAAAAGASLSSIGWIIGGVILVLLILVLLSSGGGGNVANLIPTTEYLPLGTGEGEANPNALYGDAVSIDVENPCWPASGTISQLPNTGHGTTCGNDGVGVAYHQAIDIANPASVSVYTPHAGKVCVMTQTQMGDNGKLEGYGKYVVICTNEGFDMVFAHLLAFGPGLKQGDSVIKGQQVGVMGNTGNSTGNHLHFEITNWTICRPYNILDILPTSPLLQDNQSITQSCSQYSQTGGQNVPL